MSTRTFDAAAAAGVTDSSDEASTTVPAVPAAGAGHDVVPAPPEDVISTVVQVASATTASTLTRIATGRVRRRW
ncbi:hypothetical protein ACFQV8_20290 [Pseudonocardia benzenivorans]